MKGRMDDIVAVDVVILLPDDITEKALGLNRSIVASGSGGIALDAERCLPHITLAMGCISRENLKVISSRLDTILEDRAPVTFKSVPSRGGKAWIELQRDGDIKDLHESVMSVMIPFFNRRVSRRMFYTLPGESINFLTWYYVKCFYPLHSGDRYAPHITIGAGKSGIEVPYMEFTTDRLAVCHLGNYCTCREVLFERRLTG